MNLYFILKKLKNRIDWIFEDYFWDFYKLFYQEHKKSFTSSFSIGITTFLDRYTNCFKPLLKKVTILFPECQIIVVANGHVKKKKQIKYLKAIELFCNRFNNVQLISYQDPKGLSFIWNRIIESSNFDHILIFNDDLRLKASFRGFMYSSGIVNSAIGVINKSWSHFMISKDLFKQIGQFDEGLLEIGGEDDDYSARLAINRVEINHFSTSTISGKLKLKKKRLEVNSYGRDMNKESFGYSTYNNEYIAKKWETNMEFFEGAVEVPDRIFRYWKLKEDL